MNLWQSIIAIGCAILASAWLIAYLAGKEIKTLESKIKYLHHELGDSPCSVGSASQKKGTN